MKNEIKILGLVSEDPIRFSFRCECGETHEYLAPKLYDNHVTHVAGMGWACTKDGKSLRVQDVEGPWQAWLKQRRQEWATPPKLYRPMDAIWNFTWDAAATAENCKGKDGGHFGPDRLVPEYRDGLKASWERKRIFCNPGFGNVAPWMQKAEEETRANGCPLAVVMSHMSTGSQWWYPAIKNAVAEIHLIKRPKFIPPPPIKASTGMKDIALVVFMPRKEMPMGFAVGELAPTQEAPQRFYWDWENEPRPKGWVND